MFSYAILLQQIGRRCLMLDYMILQELLGFLGWITTPIIAQIFDLFPKLAFNESFEFYEFFKTLSFVFPKIT